MDAIILKDKPTDDRCNNCSIIYITNGIIFNGVRHVLVDNSDYNFGCKNCSMIQQCTSATSICVSLFGKWKCHFEIK